MARALAICEGGPLDGVVVSIELDPEGKPQPLESRENVCGVLYVPVRTVQATSEFPKDADLTFDWADHVGSYVYEVAGG